MNRHHSRRYALVTFLLYGLFSNSALPAADAGLGISPGVSLIEDAPLGIQYDLGTQGLDIQVSNRGDMDDLFEVVAVVPSRDQIASFEAGYEPFPDISWVHLHHETLNIPAHGTAHDSLVLDIPARPDLSNRHFVLFVEASPKPTAPISAILRVRARVLIETVANAHPGTLAQPGGTDLAPGRIEMVPHGDGLWSGEVEITNNANHPATYDLLTLRQAYGPGEEDRRTRFFGLKQKGLIDQDWVMPDTSSFVLPPGATRDLHLIAKPLRALETGEQVDEVLFLARRAVAELPLLQRRRLAGTDYDRSEIIRLRYSAAPLPTK